MWGYLTEFWDAIVIVGDYPIAWFQSVGNAVAGAIGGLFEDLTHHFYDIFYIAQWFLENLGEMLSTAFTPLTWIFSFVRGFFSSATMSLGELGIEVPAINLISDNVKAFFEVVPYFNLFTTAIAGVFGIMVVIFIVKKASQI
jgi:hypothetical protein